MLSNTCLSIFLALSAVAALPAGMSGTGPANAPVEAAFRAYKNIVQPANTRVRTIVRAIGVQNYTCSSAGKFVSTGARARLFDLSLSCPTLPDCASSKDAKTTTMMTPLVGPSIGMHWFDAKDGKLDPIWDFGNGTHDEVRGKAAEQAEARIDPATSVPWRSFSATTKGQYAEHIIRSETIGGQPPPSCHLTHEAVAVPYEATYWFFVAK